jgi:hypothetical protein
MQRREFLLGLAATYLQHSIKCKSTSELAIDQHGLIVQTDGDGGDTAQREGWAWFGSWIREHELHDPWSVQRCITFELAMSMLEIDQSGTFRRNPDKYNEAKDFSRDQSIPIIAAMGFWGDAARLERFWERTKARSYLTQNGEMLRPDGVNLFLRARGIKPGIIGDVQLYGGVVSRLAQAADRNDVGDDLNLLVILLMAKLRFPATNTGVPGTSTEEVIRLYADKRPRSYGSYLQSYRREFGVDLKVSDADLRKRMDNGIAKGWKPDADCPPVLGALRWYFRAESKGNPELAELYAPIVRKWFNSPQ